MKIREISESRLNELSLEKLGAYKKAAGADASKADKAGDFARGNKRFSGIIQATKKEFDKTTKKLRLPEPKEGVAEDFSTKLVRGPHGRISLIDNNGKVLGMIIHSKAENYWAATSTADNKYQEKGGFNGQIAAANWIRATHNLPSYADQAKMRRDQETRPDSLSKDQGVAEGFFGNMANKVKSAFSKQPTNFDATGKYPDGSSLRTPNVDEWKKQFQQAVMAVKNAKTQQEYEAASDRAGRIKELLASRGVQVGPVLGAQGVAEDTGLSNLTPDQITGITQMLQNGYDIPTIIRIFDNKPTKEQIIQISKERVMSLKKDQGVAEGSEDYQEIFQMNTKQGKVGAVVQYKDKKFGFIYGTQLDPRKFDRAREAQQALNAHHNKQGVAEGSVGDDRGDYRSTARAANQASRTAKSRRDHAKAADLHNRAATYALSSGQDQSVIRDHQMTAREHYLASKGLKEQGVAEGADVEYVVVIRDEQGKRSIRISALTPTDAKEKAEAQGYKVLKVKDPRESNYFRDQGVAEGSNEIDQQAHAIADKLTTGKNLEKLRGMAYDSTVYRALDRYFEKHNIPETIYNRVAKIVFQRINQQGVAEGSTDDGDDYDDGEDRLSGRHGLSADPKKMAVYYPNDPERTKIRTQMNIPNLKKAIQSNLGKHKKPNLPEQGVAEGHQDDSKEREENLRYSRSRNPVADAIRKKLNPNQKEQNKKQGVAEGDEMHPDAHKVLQHIKPEHHKIYIPYLNKGIYKGNYRDRADVLSAAEKAGHAKESVAEALKECGMMGGPKMTSSKFDKSLYEHLVRLEK